MDYSFSKSLWAATAGPAPADSPFEVGAHHDVAIVGAGLTGAVAGLTLARTGARVAILEAETPGSGATGRSGGYIVPAFSAIRPGALIARSGAAGERLVQIAATGAAATFDLIRESRIECDAVQGGWYHPAPTQSAWRQLVEDTPVWNAAGGRIELLDAAETLRRTGALGYEGATFAASGGTVHPVRLVYGLLERAREHGARLHSGTSVRRLERAGERWTVETTRGAITADRVIVCSNARSEPMASSADRGVVPLLICQMATRPIPRDARTHLFEQGTGLSDMRRNLFTYRFDRDWRLISGAMPLLPAKSGARLGRQMAARLARNLGLPFVPEPEYVWFGYASVTASRLPTVFEVDRDVWAVAACNGRGLAFSAVFGKLLAEAITSDTLGALPVPLQRTERVPFREVQIVGGRLYGGLGMMLDAAGV